MFEFDPAKSEANLAKHGIDFRTAEKLWLDPQQIQLEARSDEEPRRAIVARIEDKTWFAVYTLRDDKIRMISARRARKKEQAIYEKDDQESPPGNQH